MTVFANRTRDENTFLGFSSIKVILRGYIKFKGVQNGHINPCCLRVTPISTFKEPRTRLDVLGLEFKKERPNVPVTGDLRGAVNTES